MTGTPDHTLAHVRVTTYEGLAVVLPGHGHPAANIGEIAAKEFPGKEIGTEEVHWLLQRRVMWCERYGDPCDGNGEWHRHWHAVKPTDDPACCFTVIWGEAR